jgi:hypothetical protein
MAARGEPCQVDDGFTVVGIYVRDRIASLGHLIQRPGSGVAKVSAEVSPQKHQSH